MANSIVVRIATCTISLLVLVNAEVDDDHGHNAVSYNADTFTAALSRNRNFIMFYAPWCGHCKNLAPTWDELAKLYNNAEDSPVIIGKVDCTVHTALCADHDVVGFPTLKLFEVSGDNPKRYSGKRDLESFKAFILEHSLEGGQQADSEKEEQEQTGKRPDTPEPKTSLVTLTDDTFEAHIASGNHFIKFYAPWCGHCKQLAPTWEDLADTFSHLHTVSIAKIDCTKSSIICKEHQIRGYPTLLWFSGGAKVDQYQGARSHEALKRYVSEHLDSAADGDQATQEEEKVPEDINEGQVVELTEDNFQSQLTGSLVFIKFFAPWCGHCKRLAPTWEELAKSFASEKVKIARIDCTQYKSLCDSQQVRGYPTLKLFRDGTHISDYKGSRTLSDLQGYVKRDMEGHDEL